MVPPKSISSNAEKHLIEQWKGVNASDNPSNLSSLFEVLNDWNSLLNSVPEQVPELEF